MIGLLLLIAVPVAMWMVQTVLLLVHAMPVRLRIDARRAPKSVRLGGRITTQVALFAVILLYPWLSQRGAALPYYASLFPWNAEAVAAIRGAAAVIACLGTLYAIWLLTDRVEVKAHLSRSKCLRRLSMAAPAALFGAGVEELVFRGVLMGDLFRVGLPPSLVIVPAATIFAIAHYVRAVKRKWTFPGHLALGILLCVAFAQTRVLWLPFGIHAAGIFMIMGTRPFFWYKGPAWLTGASIFPFAGVVGIAGLGVLTGYVLTHFQ